jgi:hypothetical protein
VRSNDVTRLKCPEKGTGVMTQQVNGPGSTTRPGAAGAPPVGEQVKDAAGQAVEQAQQTAGKVVDQAKGQATSQITTQKERAAGGLGSVAQALRQTGQELRGQEQDTIGRYADTVAQQVERFAGYLRERDAAELVDDAEDLARRQPGLFLGGAVALGFLGTRFLMSSGRRTQRRQRALAPVPGTPGSFRPVTGGPTGTPPADRAPAVPSPPPPPVPSSPPPAAGPAGTARTPGSGTSAPGAPGPARAPRAPGAGGA